MLIDEFPLKLGRIVGTGRTLGVSNEQRSTHMHVLGASGTGKSKFLEYLIRQDIAQGRGLCLIDPHGELAENILRWVSRLPAPPKRFYYIAPHRDDWTVCYNPLLKHAATLDDWFLINAMKLAVVKVWDADNTKQTPQLDEWLKTSFYTAVTLGLTLPEVGMLLEPIVERNVQRQAVAEALPESASRMKSAWIELCHLVDKNRPVDFEGRVGSTMRRLAAFLDNPRLSRMFGVPNVSLDLTRCMDEGAVLLVDLSPKGRFHPDDAQLFGTLLLTDFYVQMFNRERPKRPFALYIDEFQNFGTKDLARMLDEARKFGLQLVLAHQRPGQLLNSDSAEDRDLYSAVMTNARTKVVFGGVSPEEVEPLARMLSMGVLDPEKVKREIHTRGVVDYVKEYWQAHSHASGHSQSSGSGASSGYSSMSASGFSHGLSSTSDPQGGLVAAPLFTNESQAWQNSFGATTSHGESSSESDGHTETDGVTTFPVLVPQMGEQLSTVYYETLENQLYQFMAILYDQEQRHAMVRVAGQKEPLPIETPFVQPITATAAQIQRQLTLSYTGVPWFLTVDEATALVEARKREFLALGTPAPSQTRAEHDTLKIDPSMPEPTSSSTCIAKIGNVELQARDIALLNDVFDSRFITIHHATLLHFAGMSAAEASAKRRLSRLESVGLLKSEPGHFGTVTVLGKQGPKKKEVKTLYCFTKKALDLLVELGELRQISSEEWDTKLRKRFAFDDISPHTLAHEVAMLECKAALKTAIESRHAHLKVIEFGVWPLAYEFKVQRQGRFPTQRPDGFLHVAEFRPNEDTPQNHYFYLELDRAKESLDIIAEKVEGYRHHLRNGGFTQWLGLPNANVEDHPFRLLFIIDSKDAVLRRNNICERLIPLGVETLTPLTTLDDLVRDPLGAIWIVPKTYKAWLTQGKKGPIPTIPLFEGLEMPPNASP